MIEDIVASAIGMGLASLGVSWFAKRRAAKHAHEKTEVVRMTEAIQRLTDSGRARTWENIQEEMKKAERK